MDPETRIACERHWRVPVADVYTSRELGYMAVQCPEAPIYHVQSENLLLEVLNEEGDPCAAGEVGRVVLTDLKNFATPLIRYDIGDFAEVGPPCACGRGLPVLTRIMGRTRNRLRLPSGDQIWPIFGLTRLEDFPFVRQVQVIQDSLTSLSLKVVSARALTAEEENAFRDKVRNAVGHPFDVTVSYIADVPRSASGKFEDFICTIDAP